MSTDYGVAGSNGVVLQAAITRQISEREVVVAADNVEAFWQHVFDELDELEELDRQKAIKTFVEYGRQHGIDVIAEVVDKGRSISEVFLTMARSAKSSNKV